MHICIALSDSLTIILLFAGAGKKKGNKKDVKKNNNNKPQNQQGLKVSWEIPDLNPDLNMIGL